MRRASFALPALALLAMALAGCTANADPDGDNLSDEAEAAGWDLRLLTAGGTMVRHVTSDPAVADTDGDGLLDGEEAEQHTDPGDVDTDGDGLLDGEDLLAHPGDAIFALLLGRGIVQDAVDGRFLGEARAGTRPSEWDSDRPIPDGLGDGAERRGWNVSLAAETRRVQSDPLLPDTDRDGLSDALEQQRGCDPNQRDTDHDDAGDVLDADCARNLKLAVSVTHIALNESLDPTGETDLVLTAQAGGLQQTYRQGLRQGPNNVTFHWLADVPDHGAHGTLAMPLALTFVDQDLLGDDARSGVDQQPICLAGTTGGCSTLTLQVDLFTLRFTSPHGLAGTARGESTGADGSVRFELQVLRE